MFTALYGLVCKELTGNIFRLLEAVARDNTGRPL